MSIGGKSKFKILVDILLASSKSKEWETAKREWRVTEIYFADIDSISGASHYETCSCSHYPIKEVITITNNLNQNKLIIGNCCITKIIDQKEEKRHNAIFKALKTQKINKELIEQAYYNDHFIDEWNSNLC
ncbi:MAG: hypothetical protein WA130_06385 [Candidatus Methanoperedens sp.]